MIKRENVCMCERGCVCVREGVCARKIVYVCMRESVCERERKRVKKKVQFSENG